MLRVPATVAASCGSQPPLIAAPTWNTAVAPTSARSTACGSPNSPSATSTLRGRRILRGGGDGLADGVHHPLDRLRQQRHVTAAREEHREEIGAQDAMGSLDDGLML